MIPAPPTSPRPTPATPAAILALALWLLVCLAGEGGRATAQGISRTKIPADAYARGVVLNVVDTRPDGFEFTLENRQPLDVLPIGVSILPVIVAVPPGSECQITTISGAWDFVPEFGLVEDGLALDMPASNGARYSQSNAYIRANYMDEFRSVGLVRLQVPLNMNPDYPPGTIANYGQIAVTRGARYRVTFRGGTTMQQPHPPNIPAEDPFLVEMLRGIVLNESQIETVSRQPAEENDEPRLRAWNERLIRATQAGPLVLMRLSRPGLYSVTADTLRGAGIDASRMKVSELRAFLGDEEIPMLVLGGGSDTVDATTTLVLHVGPERFDLEPWKPVWLLRDPGATLPPRRWRLDASRTAGRDTPPARLRREVEIFRPAKFIPQSPIDAPRLKWVTADIPQNKYESFEFDVAGLTGDPTAQLDLAFSGRQPQEVMIAEVYLNRRELFEKRVQSKAVVRQQEPLSAGALVEGRNILSIRHRVESEQRGGFTPGPSLSFIEAFVRYDAMPEDLPEQEFARLATLGNPPASRLALSLTAPADAGRVLVAHLRSTDVFSFQEAILSPETGRWETGIYNPGTEDSIVFSTLGSLLKPTDVRQVDAPRAWSSAAPVTWLGITWTDLNAELARLGRHRESTGEKVDILLVDDIYNAFSYGYKDYRAIRRAIRHAYLTRQAPKLRAVVLAGEGSEYWWERSPRHNPAAEIDRVPVFGWRNPDVQVRGDDSYARIVGTGAFPDVEIGRLSARNPAELRAIVDRVVRYETELPGGPWLARHLFVADDEAEFPEVSDKIIANDLGPGTIPDRLYLHTFDYCDYPRLPGRKRSTAATNALLRELSAGVFFANYFGHGGPNVWSHERLLHLRDLPYIDHGPREPVLLIASCDTAWIDYPVEPVKTSLGEYLQRDPKGGAISIWAPIAGTSSFEHRFVLGRYYDGYFHAGHRRTGALSLYSKIGYLLDRTTSYVTNQYLLLGDPGMRLPSPPSGVELKVPTDPIPAVEEETFQVSGSTLLVKKGTASVALYDAGRRLVGVPVEVPVKKGRFKADLVIPRNTPQGGHIVQATVWDGDGRTAMGEAPLSVRASRFEVGWEYDIIEGPADAPIDPVVIVQNNEARDFAGLRLFVRDKHRKQDLASKVFDIGAGEEVTFEFPMMLEDELREIEVQVYSAWDVRREHPPMASAPLRMMGIESPLDPLVINMSQLTIQRGDAAPSARITVPVFNRSLDPVHGGRAMLYRLDTEPPSMIETAKALSTMEPGSTTSLVFLCNAKLNAGRLPLRLDVTEDDTRTSETLAQAYFTAEVPSRPDLAIVGGSFAPVDASTPVGQTMYFDVTVMNTGDMPVNRYRLNLYKDVAGEPGFLQRSAVALADQEPPPLQPGESWRTTLRLDPNSGFPVGERPACVEVVLFDGLTDADPSNNSACANVNCTAGPNLTFVPSTAEQSTRLVFPGDVAQCAIAWRNDNSIVPFEHPATVTVYAEGPSSREELLHSIAPKGVPAGGGGLIQFNWTAKPGQDRVRVVLNEELEFPENSVADNEFTFTFEPVLNPAKDPQAHPRHISALPAAGYVTDLDFHPDETLRVADRPTAPGHLFEGLADRVANQDALGQKGDLRREDGKFSPIGDIPYLACTGKESAEAVSIPLPFEDADAQSVDVYLDQRGSFAADPTPSGDFNYRIGGDGEWKTSAKTPPGVVHIGRVQPSDGRILVELAGTGEPSRNEFYGIRLVPVKGTIVSHPVSVEGTTLGRLAVSADLVEGARMSMAAQFGSGTRETPLWGDWVPCGFGGRFPAVPEGATFMRWRVVIAPGPTGTPILRGITPDYGVEPPK